MPASTPAASGTSAPSTGRTRLPAASRFVVGLFRSTPTSRALMKASRTKLDERKDDVSLWPTIERPRLTATGTGAPEATAAATATAPSVATGIEADTRSKLGGLIERTTLRK